MTKVPDLPTMEGIERCIDNFGLFETLVAISLICSDKADHIRANGGPGDGRIAISWRRASNAIETCAKLPSVEKVSP